MSISLFDRETKDFFFSINSWHWGAIVEEIKRQRILPKETVNLLHEAHCNNGLTPNQCRLVASVLKEKVISQLSDTERILFNGERTEVSDDYTFHQIDLDKNYSTNKVTLVDFVEFLETCSGFDVF